MRSDIVPIFVLGSERNGTTWLCNELCRHPDIAGVQHRAHWGFHESKIYLHQKYWGDLTGRDALDRFLALYGDEDHFQLTGDDPNHYKEHQPGDFIDFFFEMMDRFARKEGVSCWVTKLDPHFYYRRAACSEFLERLRARYPVIRFVGIQRDLRSALRSSVYMEGRAKQQRDRPIVRQLVLTLHTARQVTHYRGVRRMIREQDGLMLSFEYFKDEHESALQSIIDYLRLRPLFSDDGVRFPPNSSFAVAKTMRVSETDLFVATRIFYPLFRALPFISRLVVLARDWTRGNPDPRFCRLKKLERDPKAFAEELKRDGDLALYELLFGSP
jgi:hypothetical protein